MTDSVTSKEMLWPTSKGDPIRPVWSYGGKKGMYQAEALRMFAHDLVDRIKQFELPVREAMKAANGDGLDAYAFCRMLQRQKHNLLRAVNDKQSKIDALMLEFCPGEMSAEQRSEYAKAQQPSHEPAPDWQQIARERTADVARADAEIERLQRDIETGFMPGTYARLKNLQEAERERDELRARLAHEPRAGHTYSPREGTEVCFICGFHKSQHAPGHFDQPPPPATPYPNRFYITMTDTAGLRVFDSFLEFPDLIPIADDRERLQRLCDLLNKQASPPPPDVPRDVIDLLAIAETAFRTKHNPPTWWRDAVMRFLNGEPRQVCNWYANGAMCNGLPVPGTGRCERHTQPPADKAAWIIELTACLTPMYLAGANTSAFTPFDTDHLKAVRFCRKDDAESVLKLLHECKRRDVEDGTYHRILLGSSCYAVTEHVWCSTATKREGQ